MDGDTEAPIAIRVDLAAGELETATEAERPLWWHNAPPFGLHQPSTATEVAGA